MKLVCWDYNGTIEGYDYNAHSRIIRPNFAEVLKALRADGYSSVVTTSINKRSVEDGLKAIGLDTLIDGVFGGRRSKRRDAKDYKDVLKAMQVPEDQAPQDVVVIGDKPHDHPGDLEKVVFIYNPEGHRTDARVVQKLLAELYQRGNSHFYRGFEALKEVEFDLKQEAGYHYHGRLALPKKHTGIVLSTFNGNKWPTPTLLLVPESEAKEFEQFGGKK